MPKTAVSRSSTRRSATIVSGGPSPLIRACGILLALLAAGVLGALLLASTLEPSVASLRRDGWAALAALPFQDLLLALCSVVAALCGAWLLVVSAAVVVATLRAGSTRGAVAPVAACEPWLVRACPPRIRRRLIAACGVAMATGLSVSPATAAPPDGADRATAARVEVTGLAVPDRPAGRRAASAPSRPAEPAQRWTVVRPGDSLWSIARADLGPFAPDRDVLGRVRAVYAANRARIGDDPDLIFPATRLQLPRHADDPSTPNGGNPHEH